MGLPSQQLGEFDMTIPTNREHLDNGSPGGSRVRGLARQVINGETTRTLLAGESGALVLFNVTAGQTITLPVIGADDIGMYFDFLTTVIGTGSYSIDTDAATTFIGGGLIGASATADLSDLFAADIAATVSIDLDSATTGEEVGSQFTLTALSTTTWGVGGYVANTGIPATPFA
jgi:hypothetical protein